MRRKIKGEEKRMTETTMSYATKKGNLTKVCLQHERDLYDLKIQ